MSYRRVTLYVLLVLPMLLALAGCGGNESVPTPTAVAGVTAATPQDLAATPTTQATSDTSSTDVAQPEATRADAHLYDIGEAVTSKPEFSTSLAVMGAIKYKGSVARVNPEISIVLLDASGKVLVKGNAFVVPSFVRPQSTIPYKALFSTPPQTWDKIDVTINAREVDASTLTYGDLEVTQPSLAPPATSFDSVKLTGSVKNTGSKEATLVTVVGVLYDGSGKVADVNNGFPEKATMAAGDESKFEIDFFGIDAADKFELFASGVANK